ncbi:MAG: hypothetical protein PHR28_08085 [candidate division Zixibacteria bacterium]|nr:hypothetical protein [candidate division Zixibacteria bacterium]
MPRRKISIRYPRKGEKRLWHPYGLQSLRPDRFVSVANRILLGRYSLIRLGSQPTVHF